MDFASNLPYEVRQKCMNCMLQFQVGRMSHAKRASINIHCRLKPVAGPDFGRNPSLEQRADASWKLEERSIVIAHRCLPYTNKHAIQVLGPYYTVLSIEVSSRRKVLAGELKPAQKYATSLVRPQNNRLSLLRAIIKDVEVKVPNLFSKVGCKRLDVNWQPMLVVWDWDI